MNSIWSDTAKKPNFEHMDGDIRTDVLIVGGGICGILCAYMLKEAGVDYVLAEAEEICGGITKNTTAKITAQHGLIYDKIIRTFGIEKARLYFEANKLALEKYRTLCQKIECDYKEMPSYVYSLDDKRKIEDEITALHKIEATGVSFADKIALPFSVAGAVKMEHQAQFHPLKFAYALSEDLNVLEHTKIIEIRDNCAITDNGKIFAKKFIIATHFPFMNKFGGYSLKLYQHRSYVLALENAADVDGMYVDEDKKGLSFRNQDDLLILGGGSHRTGKKGGSWGELSAFAKEHYPNAKEVARWATQDCMSLDGVPYIGSYSGKLPNAYVATGFNKWGFSSSMVAAMLLTDLILEKETPYVRVFSPVRSVMHPQLAINTAEAVINLLTPTVPRCPHLACALKYNKQEHSWDCPCHGSRFEENGKLIDNPSTGELKSKRKNA